MHWLVPLLLLNLGLIGLGVYLIARAFQRIHHYDRLMTNSNASTASWPTCWIDTAAGA